MKKAPLEAGVENRQKWVHRGLLGGWDSNFMNIVPCSSAFLKVLGVMFFLKNYIILPKS